MRVASALLDAQRVQWEAPSSILASLMKCFGIGNTVSLHCFNANHNNIDIHRDMNPAGIFYFAP